ncbi:MAG: Hsp20/alpha crystallin family protein [Deltaproteobacteria bacterium]|nr:Hsp20/alpha crystallin family protein [Deltaproteobacteria bacterium]
MLIRWNPFRAMPLSSELQELLRPATGNGGTFSFAPALDLEEHPDRFVLKADLPGMSEKEIEVKLDEGRLVLTGKREFAQEEKHEGMLYRERRSGSFCRTVTLGEAVDVTGIEATYKDGVLTVVLPKRPEVQPRTIPVKA